jgi:hypothetical protein
VCFSVCRTSLKGPFDRPSMPFRVCQARQVAEGAGSACYETQLQSVKHARARAPSGYIPPAEASSSTTIR